MRVYQLSSAAVEALRELPAEAAKDVRTTVRIALDRDHPDSRYVLLKIKVDGGVWSLGYLMEEQTHE